MKSYDAIIVGGGPAGSTLAWQLGRIGWKPLIVDKFFLHGEPGR